MYTWHRWLPKLHADRWVGSFVYYNLYRFLCLLNFCPFCIPVFQMALFLNPMFLFPIGLKMYAMSVLFLFQHFTYPVFQTGPKKMFLPPFKLNCKYSMKREIK